MDDSVRAWDDNKSEGYAQALLADAEVDGIDIPLHPLILGHRLGVSMSPLVQSYCRGMLDVHEWSARYDGRGSPQQAGEHLAHEFGHLAPLNCGVPHPHCERCVDRVAMALWMPRAAMEKALTRVGANVPRLLSAFAEVPPRWVLERAAWVASRPLILHTGRVTRAAWSPEGWEIMPPHVERLAVAGVRATGRPMRVRWGGMAWPCEALGSGAVAIFGGDEIR